MGVLINNKKIKDPLFLSVKKFMDDRLDYLAQQGRSKALERAKRRYTGLTATDVVIEPPVFFDNGIVRCCFVSRKTGFFRADVTVEKININKIFDEFSVSPIIYNDQSSFILSVKNGKHSEGIFNILEEDSYSLLLSKEGDIAKNVMRILNDIYWDKITITLYETPDQNNHTGKIIVEATNIDPYTFNFYAIENIK